MTVYRISTETNFRKGTQVLKKDNARNVKEKLKAQTSVNTVNKESKLNPNEMKKIKKVLTLHIIIPRNLKKKILLMNQKYKTSM